MEKVVKMSPKFGWRSRLGWTGHRKAAAPSALGEDLKTLPHSFTVSRLGSFAPPNYAERRAIELYKIEVDRQRALAAMYYQRRMNQ